MRAVRIAQTGGPEVLEVAEVDLRPPVAGEVIIRHEAIGLNFIDTYQRSGLYPLKLPATLGMEAAGVVAAIGDGVEALKVGDRVGYNGQPGAYAEANVVRAERGVKLPDDVSTRDAAAVLLKGMTAEFLIRRVRPLRAGDWVVVHAAAGGVGSILCPWLAHLGVRVVGMVGSDDKVARAKAGGCEEVLTYRGDEWSSKIKAITGGGAELVFDSVGKATQAGSLDSLRRRGLLISFGAASGAAPPLAPSELQKRGSLFLTRPTLYDYVATPQELKDSADALFEVMEQGVVKADVGQTFPLDQARQAHEALEGRRTTGSTLLIP